MEQKPMDSDNKRSMSLIMAIIVTIAASVIIFFVIDFIGLFLRILLGLGLIGFISPFYEEPLKILGPILIGLFFAGTFKSKKTGAILGIIAGAVFGLLEIFDYWVLFQPMISAGTVHAGAVYSDLVVRLITSLPMHAISSLIAGLGVAYAAMSSLKPRFRDFFSGNALTFLLVAIGFHFFYNVCNLVPSLLLKANLIGLILAFIVMLGGLYLAYRVYKVVPSRLNQLPVTGANEIVMQAFGRKAKKGAAIPDKGP
jgi:uncharacterized membrane protein (UPF0182 family)